MKQETKNWKLFWQYHNPIILARFFKRQVPNIPYDEEERKIYIAYRNSFYGRRFNFYPNQYTERIRSLMLH